jgi:hypothetical protein
MSENVGASTSHNPKGLHGLYRENFTLLLNKYLQLSLEEEAVIDVALRCVA